MDRKTVAVLLAILAVLAVIVPVAAASWGGYQAYEEITITASELSSTAITWHPFSKGYSTSNLLIGVQPVNIVFNGSAAEKKFVIEIAGSDPSCHLDLAFFDTGVIDIVETTADGSTKLTDTSGSGVSWQNFEFIVVVLDGSSVKLEGDNGTVLATATWSSVPASIEQIGASGGADAVESGQVIVAIIYDPYAGITESMSGIIASMIPLIITVIGIGLVLGVAKYMLKMVKDIIG